MRELQGKTQMLSSKLVQLIETNWEEITNRLIAAVRTRAELPNLQRKTDPEMREWCRNILQDLDYLLTSRKEQEMHRRFEVLGRMRCEENIPLHEAVLRFHILKHKIIEFVHEQGFPMSAMHLHAEIELELRVGRFFDDCVYHVVRGYEAALRVARLAS
jgi:hypothetical protein